MADQDKKRAERDEMIEQINAQLSSKPAQMGLAIICILVFIGVLYYGFFA